MRRALPFLTLLVLTLGASAAPLVRNPQLVAAINSQVNGFLTGDFNGDGHTDLLGFSATSLTVLLDNGTGPFAKPVTTPITTPFTSFRAAAGDVNGDGRTDFVAFDFGMHSIEVFFGNVDGTFTPGPITPTSIPLATIAVGDFNGDHHLDVVLGTTTPASNANTVTTFFGDGSGNFAASSTTVTGDPPSWLEPVDLNGDGKTDIVVVSLSATAVWLSKGDGTFAAGAHLGRATPAFGDFNHDGKTDLALAADYGVDVYFGNGDGTATKSATYLLGGVANGPSVNSLEVGDVNGDGNLDLVAASIDGTISVILGKADGTFQKARTFLSDDYTTQVFLSDFDRDGKLDVLMSARNEYVSSGTLFSLARGNGNGTFGLNTAAVTSTGYQPHDGNAVIADVNRDGKQDVVLLDHYPGELAKGYRLSVLLNDGTGRLSDPIITGTGTFGWDQSPSLTVADVNGDGIPDAVILSNPQGKPAGESLLGNGDGTFGAPIAFSIPAMGKPHIADFDGDGIPDLLVSADNGYVLQHGSGNGTFAAGAPPDLYEELNRTLLVADLNGDGKMDFVGTHSGFQLATYTSVFLNDGKGNFTESTLDSVALAVGDFNHDGKPDILSRGTRGIEVRLGRGDGTFGQPIGTYTYFAGESIRPAVAADFNGDGYMDVALDTTIYLGRGDGTFSSASTVRANVPSNSMAADMDGNGSSDLLFLTYGYQVGIVLTNSGSDPETPSFIALASDGPTTLHANATLTATVTGGATPLGGMVAFAADETTFAIVPVGADGKASATFTAPFGTSTVRVTYTGDEYYRGSTTSLSLSAAKVATSVNLSSDINPQTYGTPINFYAFVVVPTVPPVTAPTGLIILHEGSYVLGTIRANGAALRIQGGALSVGTHVITADYVGDATYKPSTTTLTQVVIQSTTRKRATRH